MVPGFEVSGFQRKFCGNIRPFACRLSTGSLGHVISFLKMNSDYKKIGGICFLLIFSPVGLLLAYGNFELLKYSTSLFFEVFNKWPWVRASLILTIVTSLSAHVLAKELSRDGWFMAFFYSLVITSVMLLLLYPGLEKLELHSDPNLSTSIFYLTLIHTIGFKLIADAEKEERLRKSDVDSKL